MLSATQLSFSAQQYQLLTDSLDFFDADIPKNSAKLRAAHAVLSVFWTKEGKSLEAELIDNGLHTVTIDFEDFDLKTPAALTLNDFQFLLGDE